MSTEGEPIESADGGEALAQTPAQSQARGRVRARRSATDVPVRRKPGRRPGGADTRQAILDAARAQFAARGYENTSMRAIARAAEVNSALLHHYFGTKDQLFLAALDFPLQPRELAAGILGGGPEDVGERLVRFVFGLLEDPAARERVVAALRATATNEQVARLFRGFMVSEVIGPVAAELGTPEAALRIELAMTQIVGMVMGRYVLAVEPLASAPVEELIAHVAPTVQRYLAG